MTGGGVGVGARNAAQLNATVSNVADSVASALFGATGKSIGGVLVSNKVASAAEAGRRRIDAVPAGAVDVGAEDAAGIFANAKLVSSSVTSNDGGAAVIQSTINKLTPANYQTDEGCARCGSASACGSPPATWPRTSAPTPARSPSPRARRSA